MPEQKTTDSRNGYFLTVDRFTDASAIQVESVDADGNLTFDFDSITSLKDSVSVKEGAGYAGRYSGRGKSGRNGRWR